MSKPLLWFHYSQNNSGGRFVGPPDVFVQAATAEEADELGARVGGLYFGGLGDCPCCGDRWYPTGGEGQSVPTRYNKAVFEDEALTVLKPPKPTKRPDPYCGEHKLVFADGTVRTVGEPGPLAKARGER